VLISVWIEGSQPLAGTAEIEGGEPMRFDGWLELLRVISELVDAAPPGGGDADVAERADARSADEDAGPLHPESQTNGQATSGGAR
jgi:hypothetical protein